MQKISRDANYRRLSSNSFIVARYYFARVVVVNLRQRVRDADAEARHMSAGVRQTSGLTQILRSQLWPGFHRDW